MISKQALLRYCSVPQEKLFRQFRNGAMLFFAGFVAVYGAHQSLVPSLEQELAVLGGICFIALGFVIAILAQFRLIAGRFLQFFLNK